MDCERLRASLYAFLDGELDVKDTIEIEQHITACPMCDALVRYEERFRKQVLKMLKREPAPETLIKRIEDGLNACSASPLDRMRRFSWNNARFAIAALATAAVLIVAVTLMPNSAGTKPVEAGLLIEDAVTAHLEYLTQKLEPEFKCSAETTETEKWQELATWFQGRLTFAIEPPDIDFEPIGGRLHHLKGERVAYFVCRCQKSHDRRLSLFAFDAQRVKMPKNEITVFADRSCYCSSTKGLTSVMWEENGVAFLAVGNLERNSMLARLFIGGEENHQPEPAAL
jgi:mycothiol system anti-sigma-R factor